MEPIHTVTLPHQVKQLMINKKYSLEDLEYLQHDIKRMLSVKTRNFRIIFIIASIILFMFILILFNVKSVDMSARIAIISVSLIFELYMLFMKFIGIDLIRIQFIRLINQNYPEYIDNFRVDTFK